MQLSDFHVGQTFQWGRDTWSCTDIGCRTIAAIRVYPQRGAQWRQGPPYAPERVFDEGDIALASLTRELSSATDLLLHEATPEFRLPAPQMAHQDLRRAQVLGLPEGHGFGYPLEVLEGVRVDGRGHALAAFAVDADRSTFEFFIEAFDYTAQVGITLAEADWFALPFHPTSAQAQAALAGPTLYGTERALERLVRQELRDMGGDPAAADAFLATSFPELGGLRPLSALLGRPEDAEAVSEATQAFCAQPAQARQKALLACLAQLPLR